jgi:hypothetical protein
MKDWTYLSAVPPEDGYVRVQRAVSLDSVVYRNARPMSLLLEGLSYNDVDKLEHLQGGHSSKRHTSVTLSDISDPENR